MDKEFWGDIQPILLAMAIQGAMFGMLNWHWQVGAPPLFYLMIWLLLIILPFVVVVLIAVYTLKLFNRILFNKLDYIWPLLVALLILTAPEGLIRTGFCFKHLRFSTNDDLIRYAIDSEIRKKQVDPTIKTVEQFYEWYDRERCCVVKEYKDYFRGIPSAPWYILTIDDFFSGPTAEVALSYGAKNRHILVGSCGGTENGSFTSRNSQLNPRFGRIC